MITLIIMRSIYAIQFKISHLLGKGKLNQDLGYTALKFSVLSYHIHLILEFSSIKRTKGSKLLFL